MTAPKRLFRRSSEGKIGGVCAGIAEYLDADVTLIRLVWVVLSIVPGGFVGGVIAYLAAWLIMPDATGPVVERPAARRLARSVTDRKIAGVCGGLAEYFEVDPTLTRVVCAILAIVPGSIVLGILSYLVAWFIMPAGRAPETAPVASVV